MCRGGTGNHRDGSLIHSDEEYLVVTRKINIFALYNVNKHSMLRQKREKNGTGICHVMQGKESKTCPCDLWAALIRSIKKKVCKSYLAVVIIILLSSCSNFESKLSQYMEKDMPSCTDTTYWRLVDLQDVIGVKYDKLYLIGSEFEEDIAKGTGTDWKDGDFISWDKDLLLLVKGNEIVYKDVIEKADKRFYAFDKFCLSEDSIVDPLCEYHKTGWPLIEKSTLYYIRTDVIKGKRYYTLYNKERMEHGKTYFQPWKWLKDPKRTPWGQRKSRGKIKGTGF